VSLSIIPGFLGSTGVGVGDDASVWPPRLQPNIDTIAGAVASAVTTDFAKVRREVFFIDSLL
jgi:hypothetical protein